MDSRSVAKEAAQIWLQAIVDGNPITPPDALAIAKDNQKKEEPVAQTSEQKAILAKLREASDTQFTESDITFKGTKLIVPSRWSYKKAIDTLIAQQEAEEQPTGFNREYRYRPFDVAHAVELTIRQLTGMSGVGQRNMSFFGSNPPQRINVQTGVDTTIDVPWGSIHVPLFDSKEDKGVVTIGGYDNDDYGEIGYVSVSCAKKYKPEIMSFFEMIGENLREHSIYRGKAFTGGSEPEFLDLDSVDPDQIIYSDDVLEQLNAHVWGPLRYAESMRDAGVSLKRSVLFYGPYGTGKTLGGLRSAQIATANGWTFIIARPGKDSPQQVLQTARLYAPSMVFIEDIDTLARADAHGADSMSALLDSFDSITDKNVEIINVMTTNHERTISKGMLRPGRLDALIEIAELDLGGVTRMVQATVPDEMLDGVDYDVVYDAMRGYLPAFVKEAITRATLASIDRGQGELLPLNTADLVNGAHSLRPQYELMERAGEVQAEPTLDATLRRLVTEGVTNDVGLMGDHDGSVSHHLVQD